MQTDEQVHRGQRISVTRGLLLHYFLEGVPNVSVFVFVASKRVTMSKAEDTLLKLLRPKSHSIVKAVEETQSPVPPPAKKTKLQNVRRTNAGSNVTKQPGKRAPRDPVSKKGAKVKELAPVKEKKKTAVENIAQPVAASVDLSPLTSNPPSVTTPHQARMRTASQTPSMTNRNREEAARGRQTPQPHLPTEYATGNSKQQQQEQETLYFDYEGYVCCVVENSFGYYLLIFLFI